MRYCSPWHKFKIGQVSSEFSLTFLKAMDIFDTGFLGRKTNKQSFFFIKTTFEHMRIVMESGSSWRFQSTCKSCKFPCLFSFLTNMCVCITVFAFHLHLITFHFLMLSIYTYFFYKKLIQHRVLNFLKKRWPLETSTFSNVSYLHKMGYECSWAKLI